VKDAEAKFEDDLAAYTKATPTATYRHPSSFDTVSDGAGGDRADAIKLQENDTRRTAKTWMMEGDTHARTRQLEYGSVTTAINQVCDRSRMPLDDAVDVWPLV
jgi:hypothetical protein